MEPEHVIQVGQSLEVQVEFRNQKVDPAAEGWTPKQPSQLLA
jgi:hypothetical protein